MERRFGSPRIEINAAVGRTVAAAPLPKMAGVGLCAHRGHRLRYIVNAKYRLRLII
jgi:hypothetical protein